ncbi:AbfB domain-containing protein [Thermoactinospora rubra]|uniref:AbfB domain-containing protein n=1 Tax=Thermoactinospora rubra TaxID=1088767 RepID=UPI000A11367F|nr:AbfB domain-containing protein [Thermoactinospora rubra]
MIRLLLPLLLLTALLVPTVSTAAPAAAAAPLTTPWPADGLPEYPRPQLVRPDWQNLNGTWQFTGAAGIDNPPVGQNLPETVRVPYPVESALSGVQRHETFMYYRRTFTVPAAWSGRRVKLNFGAVNWRARVWVNGTHVGQHTGAYDPFSFDITSALRSGANELVVGVHSPVDAGGQPVGKQRLNPGGIFYTAASGIWQTVWLEPVNAAHITRLDTTPNLPAGALDLVVKGTAGEAVRAVVLSGGQQVAAADGTVGRRIRIPIPNARLWSPEDPFLYDLRVSLAGGDTVTGYFGMRSVGKAFVGGVLRPVLNGRFVFNIGTLDQGYWPDGIYTAPSDAALRFDLEQQKALGFNTVRKHIKVEPARWFYWADRLGLMVWQDMPSMRTGVNPSAADRATFEDELYRMVDNLRGITSIVQWIPFNEGWGEYDPARIADLVKSWDPTRLVNNNSGSNCCGWDGGNGDVVDDHIYVGPGTPNPATGTRVAVLGEFGGLGLRVPGHEWSPGNGFAYEMTPDSATLNRRYEEVTRAVKPLVTGRGLSGSIYTQPTDVENEVNGLYTYDRRVLKADADRLRAVHRSVLDAAAAARVNRLVSLRVTTPGHTDRYVRDSGGLGVTEVVGSGSADALKRDSSFWVRPGLADPSCVSFESRVHPGHYLRHRDHRVRREAGDGSALFRQDATFCVRPGLSGTGLTYESYNLRGHYLRHIDSEVYIARPGGPNPWDAAASFAQDVSWQEAPAWWRSGADLAAGQNVSLKVVTPCCTDRYLRHQDGLAFTEVVTAAGPALLKADATFTVRRGLADPSCVSLESRNFPGHYLRHSQYRIRKDARDGTALFDADATFCAMGPLWGGSGVSLESLNYPGYHIRHYYSAVYLAGKDGAQAHDTASTYAEDSTWQVAAPWTP